MGWRSWVTFLLVGGGSFLLGAEFGTPLFGRRAPRAEAARSGRPAAPLAETRRPGGEPAAHAADTPRPLPLPGEFEPQSALMLGCNELAEFYPEVLVDIVAAMHRNVHIIALVTSESQAHRAWKLLRDRGVPTDNVRFVIVPLDSMWVRDYGPIFTRRPDGTVCLVDATYSPRNFVREDRLNDEAMPKRIGDALGLPVVSVPLDIDGGNLLTNGEGLCVSTSTLIAENTQLGHDPQQVALVLRDRLGFTRWVYVKPLQNEPTGHADMFVTFLAADVAVVGRMDPVADPVNARIMDEAAELLGGIETSKGPMKVHRIPMPPVVNGYWRTYTNVIMANGTLVMPTFADADMAIQEEAMTLYATLLPGWRIVGIPADSLVQACGLLHCFSLNVPGYVKITELRAPSGAGPSEPVKAPPPAEPMPLSAGTLSPDLPLLLESGTP